MVTGLRARVLSVKPLARPTARTSWPSSVQKPSRPIARAPDGEPCSATGASAERDPERRDEQERERRGQQELPRDREDLVNADAHEAPPHPRHHEEDQHRLEEEPRGASPP